MKLVKRVSSRRALVDERRGAEVEWPLLAEGETILPKGWMIHARIRNVKRAGKNCQPGSIDWELEPPAMPGHEKNRDSICR